MKINKVERAYSRSIEYVKPNGTTLWLKHTAVVEATLEDTDDVVESSKMLHEVAIKQVSESIGAEKAQLDDIFAQKGSPKANMLRMPRL